MSPRATDWSLALAVALLAASGLATFFSGSHAAAIVFAVHDALGLALVVLVAWKLRRVRGRVAGAGRAALVFVALVLASGVWWTTGAGGAPFGYSLLTWHGALGFGLAVAVAVHAGMRAKPLRRRDVADRRAFLLSGATLAAGVGVWAAQRPFFAVLGLRGAHRRFTGSLDAGSYTGNAFPTTSWVADNPAPDPRARVRVTGLVARPLVLGAAELDAGHACDATLDCTGGFYSRQRWRGMRLGALFDRVGLADGASHVRVISRTGYRWTFRLEDARAMLLATHVGDEPLSHGHGAPVRLVAPGRRGFQWVKWVDRIDVTSGPDPGAPIATLFSSL